MAEKNKKTEITDLSLLPKVLYHLVPESLYEKFIDKNGNYDCRYKAEWGKNVPYIHTTPEKRQLKERVADMNWSSYPAEEKFVLLKINPKKAGARYTKSETEGYTYYHIWGALPKESFKAVKVRRDKDGKFVIK